LQSQEVAGVCRIGMKGIDLVMIIQNEKGMQRLIGSGFQFGADASAAAGPVGRHASANTDWKLNAEVLTYSRAKGAFAGLTLNGTSPRAGFYAARLPLQLRPNSIPMSFVTPSSVKEFWHFRGHRYDSS
jgi:hypothetical protein